MFFLIFFFQSYPFLKLSFMIFSLLAFIFFMEVIKITFFKKISSFIIIILLYN